MRFETMDAARVTLPRSALSVIFDECDKFSADETGGRIIGTYDYSERQLHIHVQGIIGPGPAAQRNATFFGQDGEYQERVFRHVEEKHANIEHLGNWHTHHVNGLRTLSGGDVTTYRRIVNHEKHNTTFFYALLVVAKRKSRAPHERYHAKHYLLRRSDDAVYEIPPERVELVDSPLVWPADDDTTDGEGLKRELKPSARPERIYDKEFLSDFYHGLRPYASGAIPLYWRGPLELIDGSHVEIVVPESTSDGRATYTVMLRKAPESLDMVASALAKREFPSARAAVRAAECACNRALFEGLKHGSQAGKR